MKENDLHHFSCETCWLGKSLAVCGNNRAAYFEATSASKKKKKKSQLFHFIQPLQAGKKKTIQQQIHHSWKWKSDETTVNLWNANQELSTWINLLEHYRARVLIIQRRSENGDKHCHLFLHGVPTHSENQTWFIDTEGSQIFTTPCSATDTWRWQRMRWWEGETETNGRISMQVHFFSWGWRKSYLGKSAAIKRPNSNHQNPQTFPRKARRLAFIYSPYRPCHQTLWSIWRGRRLRSNWSQLDFKYVTKAGLCFSRACLRVSVAPPATKRAGASWHLH